MVAETLGVPHETTAAIDPARTMPIASQTASLQVDRHARSEFPTKLCTSAGLSDVLDASTKYFYEVYEEVISPLSFLSFFFFCMGGLRTLFAFVQLGSFIFCLPTPVKGIPKKKIFFRYPFDPRRTSYACTRICVKA